MRTQLLQRRPGRALIFACLTLALAACGGDKPSEGDETPDASADAGAGDVGGDALGETDGRDDSGSDGGDDDAAIADAGRDTVEPDVGGDTAQPDTGPGTELPPEIVALDTIAPATVRAGEMFEPACVFLDADGEQVELAAAVRTNIVVNPERSVDIRSFVEVTPTRVGDLLVGCTAPELSLTDLTPARVVVTPGPATSTVATVSPRVIEAGTEASVTCTAYDDYGNVVDGIEMVAEAFPVLPGLSFGEGTVRAETAGVYEVLCDADGATLGYSELLDVIPATPENLAVALVPASSLFAVGGIATVVTLVTDAFGNEVPGAQVVFDSAPGVPSFGLGRFRFDAEGVFTLTATVLRGDLEPLVGSVTATVNSVGPALSCAEPLNGAMLNQAPGGTIDVAVAASDVSGVGQVYIGDTLATLGDDGLYHAPYTTRFGINFVDVRATDVLGVPNTSSCAFLVADRFVGTDAFFDDDIAFKLTQAAVDDNTRSGGINSLGDLLHTVLSSSQLTSTLSSELRAANPLFNDCVQEVCVIGCSCAVSARVDVNSVRINGPNVVDMDLVNGGLRVQARVRNIVVDLDVDTTLDASGNASASEVYVDMTFDMRLQNGQPQISVRSVNEVNVTGLDINLSGFSGSILNLIIGFFTETLESTMEDAIRDFIRSSFNDVLDDVVSNLDVSSLGASFAVPRLDGSGDINLGFGIRFSSLSVNGSRALFGLGSRFSGPTTVAWPTLGAPYAPGSVLLDPSTSRSIGAAVHLGLLNQALHTLWRGGLFEASIGGDVLGGSLPDGLSAQLSTLLPPVAVAAGDGVALQLGGASVQLVYPGIFDDPLDIRLGAVASTAIRIVGTDEIAFDDVVITELSFATDGVTLDAATRDVLEEFLRTFVQAIVDDSLNGALPALPIPAFDLPSSLSSYGLPGGSQLGISSPALSTSDRHLIVEGNFGVR